MGTGFQLADCKWSLSSVTLRQRPNFPKLSMWIFTSPSSFSSSRTVFSPKCIFSLKLQYIPSDTILPCLFENIKNYENTVETRSIKVEENSKNTWQESRGILPRFHVFASSQFRKMRKKTRMRLAAATVANDVFQTSFALHAALISPLYDSIHTDYSVFFF